MTAAFDPEPTGRRAERRREILDAAAALFRTQGYASTTIRDIGARAGVNHASSHYYFGSKAAILYTLYEEALDAFLARIDEIPEGPPDAVLADFVRAAVHEAARRPDHSAVFFQERQWLESHFPPPQCAALRARQARFRARLTETVEAGVAQGRLRPIDPGIVVETVVGIATWAYQTASTAGRAELDEAAEQCVQLVLAGARIDQGEKR
jgi:AcrR family transcriptional regulator